MLFEKVEKNTKKLIETGKKHFAIRSKITKKKKLKVFTDGHITKTKEAMAFCFKHAKNRNDKNESGKLYLNLLAIDLRALFFLAENSANKLDVVEIYYQRIKQIIVQQKNVIDKLNEINNGLGFLKFDNDITLSEKTLIENYHLLLESKLSIIKNEIKIKVKNQDFTDFNILNNKLNDIAKNSADIVGKDANLSLLKKLPKISEICFEIGEIFFDIYDKFQLDYESNLTCFDSVEKAYRDSVKYSDKKNNKRMQECYLKILEVYFERHEFLKKRSKHSEMLLCILEALRFIKDHKRHISCENISELNNYKEIFNKSKKAEKKYFSELEEIDDGIKMMEDENIVLSSNFELTQDNGAELNGSVAVAVELPNDRAVNDDHFAALGSEIMSTYGADHNNIAKVLAIFAKIFCNSTHFIEKILKLNQLDASLIGACQSLAKPLFLQALQYCDQPGLRDEIIAPFLLAGFTETNMPQVQSNIEQIDAKFIVSEIMQNIKRNLDEIFAEHPLTDDNLKNICLCVLNEHQEFVQQRIQNRQEMAYDIFKDSNQQDLFGIEKSESLLFQHNSPSINTHFVSDIDKSKHDNIKKGYVNRLKKRKC